MKKGEDEAQRERERPVMPGLLLCPRLTLSSLSCHSPSCFTIGWVSKGRGFNALILVVKVPCAWLEFHSLVLILCIQN